MFVAWKAGRASAAETASPPPPPPPPHANTNHLASPTQQSRSSAVSTPQKIISHPANHNSTILLQLQAQQSSPKKILHPQNPPLVALRSSMEDVAVVEMKHRSTATPRKTKKKFKSWLRDDHGANMSAQSLKDKGGGGLPGSDFWLKSRTVRASWRKNRKLWNDISSFCSFISSISPQPA